MRKFKSVRVRVLIKISLFIVLASICAFGQKATRVRFAKGATTKVVSGHLSGRKDGKTFVLRVRAGQTLSTAQEGDAHDITIYITGPRGEDIGDSDASCNNRREVSPTKSGDYRINVVECMKADPWRGTFKFRVTVR
jgi:hypothetical protein